MKCGTVNLSPLCTGHKAPVSQIVFPSTFAVGPAWWPRVSPALCRGNSQDRLHSLKPYFLWCPVKWKAVSVNQCSVVGFIFPLCWVGVCFQCGRISGAMFPSMYLVSLGEINRCVCVHTEVPLALDMRLEHYNQGNAEEKERIASEQACFHLVGSHDRKMPFRKQSLKLDFKKSLLINVRLSFLISLFSYKSLPR